MCSFGSNEFAIFAATVLLGPLASWLALDLHKRLPDLAGATLILAALAGMFIGLVVKSGFRDFYGKIFLIAVWVPMMFVGWSLLVRKREVRPSVPPEGWRPPLPFGRTAEFLSGSQTQETRAGSPSSARATTTLRPPHSAQGPYRHALIFAFFGCFLWNPLGVFLREERQTLPSGIGLLLYIVASVVTAFATLYPRRLQEKRRAARVGMVLLHSVALSGCAFLLWLALLLALGIRLRL